MSTTPTGLDEDRLERERRFHDERFADTGERRSSRFYSVADDARGAYSRSVLSAGPGDRVLEYGCGSGSMAFDLAAQGAEVVGIDISEVAVATARDSASEQGLSGASFEVMNAEALDLPASSFDLVCGSGILHHLDLGNSMAELARVMAPGGRAVFFEPLGHNPLINLYRRLTPGERTVDEHPLLESDIVSMREHFSEVSVRGYDLLALAALPVRGRAGLVQRLQELDRKLFTRWPRAQKMAWTVLVELSGPVYAPTG